MKSSYALCSWLNILSNIYTINFIFFYSLFLINLMPVDCHFLFIFILFLTIVGKFLFGFINLFWGKTCLSQTNQHRFISLFLIYQTRWSMYIPYLFPAISPGISMISFLALIHELRELCLFKRECVIYLQYFVHR